MKVSVCFRLFFRLPTISLLEMPRSHASLPSVLIRPATEADCGAIALIYNQAIVKTTATMDTEGAEATVLYRL